MPVEDPSLASIVNDGFQKEDYQALGFAGRRCSYPSQSPKGIASGMIYRSGG